jgi:hypothetical protein
LLIVVAVVYLLSFVGWFVAHNQEGKEGGTVAEKERRKEA